jgi:hypothetical protein
MASFVTLTEDQPKTKHRDALTYAQPFEGIHICQEESCLNEV